MRKKLIIATMFILLFVSVPKASTNASEYTNLGNSFTYKLTRGIKSMQYWYHPSIYNYGWSGHVDRSINNWMYPGWDNPIYFIPVSSNAATTTDFYGSAYAPRPDVYAQTEFLTGSNGTPVNPNKSNWSWARVTFYANTLGQTNPTKFQGTSAHEIGHAMGLDHDNSAYSIMSQSTIRKVETVQKINNDEIIRKYGW